MTLNKNVFITIALLVWSALAMAQDKPQVQLDPMIDMSPEVAPETNPVGPPPAQPQPESNDSTQKITKLGFTFGSLTEFYNAIQIDDAGKKNKFEFHPLLAFSTVVELNNKWSVIPEFVWVLPQHLEDNRITKNIFMIRADAGHLLREWLRLRAGMSLAINTIHGSGGTQDLGNGNSNSSAFYVPNETRSAINNTVDLGTEFLMDKYAFRFQTYIYSLFKQERRQVSYSLNLTYYYDLGKKP